MSDSLRDALYYCGFLSALAFFARFFIQWTYSEWHKRSILPKSFCNLSLAGIVLALLHALLQQQLHVYLVQVLNGCISWRNLNLLGNASSRWTLKSVLLLFTAIFFMAFCIFWEIGIHLFQQVEFFRVPNTPWKDVEQVAGGWHFFGTIGLILFSLRFWVQWWLAEKNSLSTLQKPFWWLSLIGGFSTLIYFWHLGDLVNAVGPAFGMIPYIRNLMLLRQTSLEKAT